MLKKSILALLLAVSILLPLTASAASPVLPDLGAFAGTLLEAGETEGFDVAQRVTYHGSRENVKAVALAYIDLLLEKYNISKHTHFTTALNGDQRVVRYALNYTGSAEIGTISHHSDSAGWHISDANVILYYSQYQADNFIQITYRHEFDYTDTGDRMGIPTVTVPSDTPESTTDTASAQAAAASAANVAAASSTSPCTACDGDGQVRISCSTCDGDGSVKHRCSTCGGDGERNCSSCSGKGYSRCSSCSGSGHRKCGSCNGTGHHSRSRHSGSHHSDSKCSTCGGDGKRGCSSCSSTGRRSCSTCSGSGDRNCSSCSGNGEIQSPCSACFGEGHRETTCTACGGAGRLAN